MSEENKNNDGGDNDKNKEDMVSKADFEKLQADFDANKKQLENTQMEVFTPGYVEYLDSMGTTEKKVPVVPEVTDDVFKGMSQKQVYDKAVADSTASFDAKLNELKTTQSEASRASDAAAVKRFAAKTPDFEDYRNTMAGLSSEKKNAHLGIEGLYDLAKEKVSGIHAKASQAEKERQEKLMGEKPGGDTGAFTNDDLSKLTPDDAANKAFDAVQAKLGDIPSVIE